MLYIATKMQELNFSQLMAVYEEGNRENGERLFSQFSTEEQIFLVEQSVYQYLKEYFFAQKGAVCAVWIANECYVSALRLEPYEDGLLLEALETAPTQRRKGYAEKLIRAVVEQFPQKIYSHVSKKNTASLMVHQKCGFVQVLDYAKYIDGSVARNAVTLCSR